MAKVKAAPSASEKLEYVVKGAGWLAGTYREDGDVVRLAEPQARLFVGSYRLQLKSEVDKAEADKVSTAKQADIDAAYKAKEEEEAKEAAAKASAKSASGHEADPAATAPTEAVEPVSDEHTPSDDASHVEPDHHEG